MDDESRRKPEISKEQIEQEKRAGIRDFMGRLRDDPLEVRNALAAERKSNQTRQYRQDLEREQKRRRD